MFSLFNDNDKDYGPSGLFDLIMCLGIWGWILLLLTIILFIYTLKITWSNKEKLIHIKLICYSLIIFSLNLTQTVYGFYESLAVAFTHPICASYDLNAGYYVALLHLFFGLVLNGIIIIINVFAYGYKYKDSKC